MCEVLYTEREGGIWKLGKFPGWVEKDLKKFCEHQSIYCVDSYHKVDLPNGIKAAAVLFHDGLIWDAIFSGYDILRGWRRKKRLPKCLPFAFQWTDHGYRWA